eukprot:scaffold4537_cov144-Isochrysis_galbana.AAC.7
MLATSCALRLERCDASSTSSFSAVVSRASSVTRCRGTEASVARLRRASFDRMLPLPASAVSEARRAGESADEMEGAASMLAGDRATSAEGGRVELVAGLSNLGLAANVPLHTEGLAPSSTPEAARVPSGRGSIARSFCRRFWNQTCTDLGVMPSCMARDWRAGADGCPPCRSKALRTRIAGRGGGGGVLRNVPPQTGSRTGCASRCAID